ncbi:type III-B CRISPR-associated protein Cas10/Cmr2 [Calothrix sp. NIES-3974]|uniref:type III-B CRISPR-associated protein Cas10/Cmr2 n=1 Tax=Calothrix sp. NIES-3974 TaxID=2005462 RepID=UPI000B6094E1|nr:type III-B CRISPR-associated protein Cas10/Cmr2 [Calothrix sp. NIES-3974]BAZ04391.1 Crm2 family CRISPR-associated protein [Calothrix sp. NIES-3974]
MVNASSKAKVFWQSKIWGILHDPILKALHDNTGRGGNSFWQRLDVMQDWVENNWNPEDSQGKLLKRMKLADYIASASDRGAIGSIASSVNYDNNGLEIKHLLSGATLNFRVSEHNRLISSRLQYLTQKEDQLVDLIPPAIRNDEEQVFWWLWRCLPEKVFELFNHDDTLMLMPAETRLPDSSIWSHASITAALAGALTGYDATSDDLERWQPGKEVSHPYVVSFTFTPVQELIKASRKMRDFWAGSWILHYIAAKICFELALKYGPDSFLYPSLFQQPLIDLWLTQKYPDLGVTKPNFHDLLTAGFPNVIVMILPKDKVEAAMQMAEQTLKETWQELGDLVFDELQKNRRWMRGLRKESKVWDGWLQAQWQFYWAGVPLGKEGEELKNAAILEVDKDKFEPWVNAQNQAFKANLYKPAELKFLRQAYQQRLERYGRKFSVNVGSWWSSIFDQTRSALNAVKNARNWVIPTVFAPRSTISGIGAVVHPPITSHSSNNHDWVTEGDTKKYWERDAGLFDGREQLNATEVVKRSLEKVLPKLLNLEKDNIQDDIAASYPDLTAGVAGYLKVMQEQELFEHWRYFHTVCDAINQEYPWTREVINGMREKWGIPWMDNDGRPQRYHPRLLNSGWLVEDAETEELQEWESRLKNEDDEEVKEVIRQQIREIKINYRQGIQRILDRYYPSANPSDWYVLAAGDGDGMSEWLKGKKMPPYRECIPTKVLKNTTDNKDFQEYLKLNKHMGPSTHSALSRALLDFSNQLVPYLTEQRYAGRLIYSGGDDVLAYTNLWEWDNWLWDIRQCFRGDKDPKNEFTNEGDYWQYNLTSNPSPLTERGVRKISKRPLFTMGRNATISFGIVIAHHSVPLAIALENMWEAETAAKEHTSPNKQKKDAVQVRILYGNGNILKATAKFNVFHQWQELIQISSSTHRNIEASIFEQAANLWEQHPAPISAAIPSWTQTFCNRREQLKDETLKQQFQQILSEFLSSLWNTTQPEELDTQVQSWLKLAAFTLRDRKIKLGVNEHVLV